VLTHAEGQKKGGMRRICHAPSIQGYIQQSFFLYITNFIINATKRLSQSRYCSKNMALRTIESRSRIVRIPFILHKATDSIINPWPYEENWPRSSPSSTRAPRVKRVSAGNRTQVTCVTGENSTSKSYSNVLCWCYSEPLHGCPAVHMAITHGLILGAQVQM